MSIKTKFIIYFSVIIIVFSVVSFYSIWHSFSVNQSLDQRISESINIIEANSKQSTIAQLLRYDDEVQTQSARNYALTGDKKWKDRYFEFIPKLELRIREAIDLGDQADKEILNRINNVNHLLVVLEEKAINYVDNKDLKSAKEILDSNEYAQEELIYKLGLDEYIQHRGILIDSGNPVSTQFLKDSKEYLSIHFNMGMYITIVLIFIFLIALIFLFWIIIRTFMFPLNTFRKVAKEITKGNLDVKVVIKNKDEIGDFAVDFNKMTENISNLYNNLDQKVDEKTKAMQDQKLAILNILEDVEKEKNKAESLAMIVRDANEPIVSQDLDGTVLSWNHGAEDLYGYSPEEVVGKSIKIIIPEDKHKEYEDIMNTTITAPMVKIEHYQTIRKKKDGTLVEVAISVSPIKDSDQKVVGLSVITLDITKEKQIDKAKTEFVSLASHQLRTPLSSINWYTEMLLSGDAGKLNDEQKKYLEEVYTGNQRMVSLVNALLNVSRLELGTFIVEPELINLIVLIQDVVKEQKPQIDEKKLNFIEKHSDNLPKINVDPRLIRIVFQNLLSNAVKYTPENGTISFNINFIKNGENADGKKVDEDSIAISISDTGYGIPENQQNKVFSKLFRADNIRAKETEGTGLGLYIVKAVVENSGGKIWFESAEDKGTTFYITLPIVGMKKKVGVAEIT